MTEPADHDEPSILAIRSAAQGCTPDGPCAWLTGGPRCRNCGGTYVPLAPDGADATTPDRAWPDPAHPEREMPQEMLVGTMPDGPDRTGPLVDMEPVDSAEPERCWNRDGRCYRGPGDAGCLSGPEVADATAPETPPEAPGSAQQPPAGTPGPPDGSEGHAEPSVIAYIRTDPATGERTTYDPAEITIVYPSDQPTLQYRLTKAQERIETLTGLLALRDGELASANAQRDQARAQVHTLTGELHRERDLHGRDVIDLTAARAEITRLHGVLRVPTVESVERQQADAAMLATLGAEVERLAAELASWRTAHRERGDEVERLRGLLGEALSEWAEAGTRSEIDPARRHEDIDRIRREARLT